MHILALIIKPEEPVKKMWAQVVCRTFGEYFFMERLTIEGATLFAREGVEVSN